MPICKSHYLAVECKRIHLTTAAADSSTIAAATACREV